MIEKRCWCGGRVRTEAFSSSLAGAICLDSEFHDPFATGKPERVEILYVAGPMSGYESCNYPTFNAAEESLKDAGYTVVNPASFGGGAHYVDLIREDLRRMLDCHGVATLEGWWESTGARNEVSVAGILKMPVRTVQEWLDRATQELKEK